MPWIIPKNNTEIYITVEWRPDFFFIFHKAMQAENTMVMAINDSIKFEDIDM